MSESVESPVEHVLSPQQRHVFAQTSAAFQHPELVAQLGGPNAAKCWSCRVGLNAAGGLLIAGAIAAAVATGGTALIPEAAALAALTGLSETAVTAIVTTVVGGGTAGGAAAVEAVIEQLCEAMGACQS